MPSLLITLRAYICCVQGRCVPGFGCVSMKGKDEAIMWTQGQQWKQDCFLKSTEKLSFAWMAIIFILSPPHKAPGPTSFRLLPREWVWRCGTNKRSNRFLLSGLLFSALRGEPSLPASPTAWIIRKNSAHTYINIKTLPNPWHGYMTIYEQELDFKSRQNRKAQFSQDVGNLSSPLTILSVNPATWEIRFLLPPRKGAGLLQEEGSLGIRASRWEGQ